MNPPDGRPPIGKILVAVDASVHSAAVLQASVELAASLGAAVTGIFIEDINLVRLAQIPFAREISFFTLSLRRLELPELERQLRAQAGQMRKLLAAYAARAGVSWDFRVVRGSVATEMLAASVGADLVVLGRRGRSLIHKMGSTARFIVSQGRGMTLILEQGDRLDLPVAVFYDGSRISGKALEAAIQLVKLREGRLSVFILAEVKDRAQEIEMDAMAHLGAYGLAANFRIVFYPTLAKLRHLIRIEGGGPVVLPLAEGSIPADELYELISEIPNPVLLVRE